MITRFRVRLYSSISNDFLLLNENIRSFLTVTSYVHMLASLYWQMSDLSNDQVFRSFKILTQRSASSFIDYGALYYMVCCSFTSNPQRKTLLWVDPHWNDMEYRLKMLQISLCILNEYVHSSFYIRESILNQFLSLPALVSSFL